jgi:DNA primase
MDSVLEIKSRLPIEQLVAQYCQLQKKGRNFVSLCPFHNDSKPSLLVSPDKGIAYCFACQSGGDIFSFYQKIEGVDFPQAIKDLADKAGVILPEQSSAPTGPKKDEKERARECLLAALSFYREQLKKSPSAQEYLTKRGVTAEEIETFQLGLAPDSFTETYDHLLKSGFSRTEVVAAGLAVQKEIEGKFYDRFRHRLMFPIFDQQGLIVAFGGRTLGDDDAKYINSTDGILYHKSNILFGFHLAKEAMRDTEEAIVVEGYFDVLACHRVGMKHVVAASGTAFTDQHAKLLKRHCKKVSLCLDQDRAGQDAAERAFRILAAEGIHVRAIRLPDKDPADTAQSDPELLKNLLLTAKPYVEQVIDDTLQANPSNAAERAEAAAHIASLIAAISNRLEQSTYMEKAKVLQIIGLRDGDLEQLIKEATGKAVAPALPKPVAAKDAEPVRLEHMYSAAEIALAMFVLYPTLLTLLAELIPPEEAFTQALYTQLKALPAVRSLQLEDLDLSPEHRERAAILLLFCEQYGFTEWSESMAAREIHKNCHLANREYLREKQQSITKQLVVAQASGQKDEQDRLMAEFELLRKMREQLESVRKSGIMHP